MNNNTLTNTVLQSINAAAMEHLLSTDLPYAEATKIVTEDYDFEADALEHPVAF